MSAQVVSLFNYVERARDWTQRELAEFYRVESALIQAGLTLETERGVTDEGEPWFVFCRADTGEAFIHFARVDGKYIAVGSALDQVVEGRDFSALVQEILGAQAWIMAKARSRSNVFLHPSALLIAIVGAAFFHSGEAKAGELSDHGRTAVRKHVLPMLIKLSAEQPAPLDAGETAAIVSSVLLEWAKLSPAVLAGRDVLPLITASSADLAPLAFARGGGTLADVLWHNTAQSDLAAPPALISHHIEVQAPAQDLIAPVISSPSVEHMDLGAQGLDAGLAPPAPMFVQVTPVTFAVVAQGSPSEAVQLVESSNLASYLALQPVVVPPSPELINLVDHGAHETLSAPPLLAPAQSLPALGEAMPPAPTPSHGPSAPPPLIDPHIMAEVQQFSAEVSTLDVAVTGHQIILYDGAIFNHLPPGTILESMTFNFADGSSISLVGTAAELQNLQLT
ncbi:MAG TPA: hypothetical protein VGN38_12270 [Caulobacteraceae bacterium]|jgi:hypothetical protein|nr:hypothetical protein [Caulobacteraceae bacterium]